MTAVSLHISYLWLPPASLSTHNLLYFNLTVVISQCYSPIAKTEANNNSLWQSKILSSISFQPYYQSCWSWPTGSPSASCLSSLQLANKVAWQRTSPKSGQLRLKQKKAVGYLQIIVNIVIGVICTQLLASYYSFFFKTIVTVSFQLHLIIFRSRYRLQL